MGVDAGGLPADGLKKLGQQGIEVRTMCGEMAGQDGVLAQIKEALTRIGLGIVQGADPFGQGFFQACADLVRIIGFAFDLFQLAHNAGAEAAKHAKAAFEPAAEYHGILFLQARHEVLESRR